MSAVQNTGTCSYNGVAFHVYSSHVSCTPEYDSARRTIKYINYDLFVDRALVEPLPGALSTDSLMATLRVLLQTPGGLLNYSSKGFGDLIVNQGTVWDAAWGPTPTLLEWTPTGNDQSALIAWRCTARVPACDAAIYRAGIAELCLSVGVTIDEDGYTILNTTGHIEIPMTRPTITTRRPPDTVDAYKERIALPLGTGFQRVKNDWKVSEDRRRGDFTFEDRQIPVPLPLNVTRAPIEHSISSSSGSNQGFINWKGYIGGSITMAAGENKADALRIFLGIVQDRIRRVRMADPNGNLVFNAVPAVLNVTARIIGDIENLANQLNRRMVLLQEVSVRDEVTGRSTHFSVTYRIIGFNLRQIFAACGMWQPLPDTDFLRWRASLAASANAIRGHANLRLLPSDDLILDLCTRQRPPVPTNNARAAGNAQVAGGTAEENPGPPNAEHSWIGYAVSLVYGETPRLARLKPLSGTITPTAGPDLAGDGQAVARATGGIIGSATTTVPDTIQEVASPSGTVRLVGRAMRVGHQIPAPRLLSATGQPLALNRIFRHTMTPVGRYGDLPIYFSMWDLEYLLPSPPATPLPSPANPGLGFSGSNKLDQVPLLQGFLGS